MILYGASGHAKVIVDSLKQSGNEILAILDDDPNISFLNGFSVTHAEQFKDTHMECIISIGNNKIRKEVSERRSFNYGKAIHPKAIIDSSVFIDIGSVVMAGVVINADVNVGKHCIINTSATVDHDCKISDFVHVSPNSTLCGGITIGEGTHIGAGAVIIPNITIGKWCTIGAGTVVIKNVPDGATIVGNPGRIIEP